MATDSKTGWRARGKRTTVIAVGLVGILVGIAVAYFLTRQPYPGNTATGGSLTVDASLPIDFSGTSLYPVNSPASASDSVGAVETFTIDNKNTVLVDYKIFATCDECTVPAGTTPTQAQMDKIDQFNNLYIKIIPNAGSTGGATYSGLLKDLTETNPNDLGRIAAGGTGTYTVKLFLQNDSGRAQPQAVQNIWEFQIDAKTPFDGGTTTTTLPI